MKLKKVETSLQGLPLGNRVAKVYPYMPTWSQSEKRRTIELVKRVYHDTWVAAGKPKGFWQGRYDFVPRFHGGDGVLDLGELKIIGEYELNAQARECVAAGSYMQYLCPELLQYIPNLPKITVDGIMEEFGNVEIVFVRGNNEVKQEWGDSLLCELKNAGLNIFEMTPKKLMSLEKLPTFIFRWIDVRSYGECQCSSEFAKWLYWAEKQGCTIINTLNDAITNKSIIPRYMAKQVYGSFFELLKGKNDLVIKPDGGASGKKITFGPRISYVRWIAKLICNCFDKSYTIWKKQKLPKVIIDGEAFAIDFNVAFCAKNDKAKFEYGFCRVQPWEEYEETLLINVADKGSMLLPFV